MRTLSAGRDPSILLKAGLAITGAEDVPRSFHTESGATFM